MWIKTAGVEGSAESARSRGEVLGRSLAPGLDPARAGPPAVHNPAADLDPVRADRGRDTPDHRGKPSGTGNNTGDRRTKARYRRRNSSRRARRRLTGQSAPLATPDDSFSSYPHSLPVNTGRRFSRKARTPSAKSSVAAQAAKASVSRLNCASKASPNVACNNALVRP